MAQRLAGKLAIITGSGSGIGKAICSRFSQEGASLVMIDKTEQKLTSMKLKGENMTITGDVSSSTFTQSVFQQIEKKYGKCGDVLVNSAGITRDNMILKITEQDFDKVCDVNLKGVFLMTQGFIASLRNPKGLSPASIINISSIIGKSGNIGQANYAASKSGVIGFTKSVGYEVGRFGVRCNSLLPGFIETPMTDVVPPKLLERLIKQIPMKRVGQPDEIANACLFLASDESSYVNCAAIEVTGGLLA